MIEAIRRKIAVTRSWFLEENAESLSQAKHNAWYLFVSFFILFFIDILVLAPSSYYAITCLSPLPPIILVAMQACYVSFFTMTLLFLILFLFEVNVSFVNIFCNDFLENFCIFAPMTGPLFIVLGLFNFTFLLGQTINPALISQVLITVGSMSILAIFASINGIFSKGVNYLKAANRVSGYNIHIYMTLFAVIAASCVSSLIFFVPVIYTASMLIATTINMVKFKNNSMSFIQNKIQNNQLEDLVTFINGLEVEDKNLQYNDEYTLLEYAARNNHIEVIRAIITDNQHVWRRNMELPEALIQKAALMAAKAGNKEIADILMVRRINGNGTFLQRAIALENIELVEYLLQNHLYDKNIYSGEYNSSYNKSILSSPGSSEPAIISAAKIGNVPIVEALIAAGANPSEVASVAADKKTALQIAVENNHIKLVKYLMFSKHVQFIELYTCLNRGYITWTDPFEKSKQMLNMTLDDEVFCDLIRERLEEVYYTTTTTKRMNEETILEAKFDEIELGINNPNKLSETNKEYLQNLINEYKETSNKTTEQLVTRDAFSRSLLGISNIVNLKKPATFRYMQDLIVGKSAGKIHEKDLFLKLKTTIRFLLKKLNVDAVTQVLKYVGGPLQNFKFTKYKLSQEISTERYNGSVKAVEIKNIKDAEKIKAEEHNEPQTDPQELQELEEAQVRQEELQEERLQLTQELEEAQVRQEELLQQVTSLRQLRQATAA